VSSNYRDGRVEYLAGTALLIGLGLTIVGVPLVLVLLPRNVLLGLFAGMYGVPIALAVFASGEWQQRAFLALRLLTWSTAVVLGLTIAEYAGELIAPLFG